MTIKLALLKSGEDVIADWHELVGEDDEVAAYLAKSPYTVTLVKTDIPESSDEPAKVGLTFFPWMPLSKEKDIPVNPDWVVTLVDPVDEVKDSYEEKVNGIEERRESGSLDNRDNTDSDS